MKSQFGWLLGLVAGVVLLVLLTPENQKQVFAQSVKTNGVFGGLLLGGTTNIISDNGTTLTRNGSAISGGGGFAGTVSNSVAQSGLLAVDATKTNGVAATFGMVTNALGYFPLTNSFAAITNALGYFPLTNSFGAITNTLGYFPLTNTFAAVTNALGYLPATNASLGNYVLKAGDTMSGTLGFSGTSTLLNLPSLTTAQKNAASPVGGSQVYDSDLGRAQVYDGAAWHSRVRLDGDTMTGTLVAPAVNASDLLVGAMAVNRNTLTHAGGNVIMDMSLTNRYWSCTLTGNVQFVLTNCSAGKWANVLLTMPATNCTPLWPTASTGITNWFGGAPSTLTGGAIGALSFYAVDSTTNSTKAAYAETQ